MPEQPSPEQVKELQEKMKNMSPEELKELQKQQCIFCQIIEGKVQSRKVYEDDKCLGILDINPANPGHVLLMPKEHYPLMPLLPDDLIGHLFTVAKGLSKIMLTAVGADGTDIFIANGSAAGQRAQHFMLHVIPRKEGDKVKMEIPVNEFNKKDVDKAKDAIIERVNAFLKQGTEVVKTAAKKPVRKAKKSVKKKVTKKAAKPAKKKPSKGKKEEPGVSLDEIAKLIQ